MDEQQKADALYAAVFNILADLGHDRAREQTMFLLRNVVGDHLRSGGSGAMGADATALLLPVVMKAGATP